MPDDDPLITVCDKCLRASCWKGMFMCDEARYAGTVDKPLSELLELKLEHPDWFDTKHIRNDNR